jgi:hypothetical protein
MFGNHLVEALRAVTLATAAFAFWKGDAATRIAAVATLAVGVITFIIHPKFGDVAGESILLAVDFASAVVFLLLAVRYASLWLGAAMLLQSAQFSLHAYYLVMEREHDLLHAWINNLDDWGILISITVGTVLAIRRRAEYAREDAEEEARRQKLSGAG